MYDLGEKQLPGASVPSNFLLNTGDSETDSLHKLEVGIGLGFFLQRNCNPIIEPSDLVWSTQEQTISAALVNVILPRGRGMLENLRDL